MRDGLQEAEARVFLDRALTDEKHRSLLGEGLEARCLSVLDRRTRAIGLLQDRNMAAFCRSREATLWYNSTARERADKLYRVAGEVWTRLGGKMLGKSPETSKN